MTIKLDKKILEMSLRQANTRKKYSLDVRLKFGKTFNREILEQKKRRRILGQTSYHNKIGNKYSL